jgi:acyl CoA:acetate/3-ketoacid CoA transferase beta subunit
LKEEQYAKEYTRRELMVVAGARELKDGEVVLAGVGLPQVSSVVAKYTHAPRLSVLLELGIVQPRQIHSAKGLSDPRSWYGCTSMTGWLDVMGMTLHRGGVDVGFLGGVQVDEYGNINSTLIGTRQKPIRYFQGTGGGANDVASLAKRVVIITSHEKRRFPKRVDYITSPGYIDGPDGRMKVGLRPGGPTRVITDLAILGFDDETLRMKLLSIHPTVSLADVRENMGFDLIIPKEVPLTPPPTAEEQRIIRTVADTTGVFTRWKG